MSGDSRKPKSDVLASIRKIMRGGSADLGDVPAPGSKTEAGATDEEKVWALPPGALSDSERDGPADFGTGPDNDEAPGTGGPFAGAPAPNFDDDDEDDDDVLPLSADMQVAQPKAPAPAADDVVVYDNYGDDDPFHGRRC